jgi:ElaB/YqjD/DUF883 family membrane-anchored ribosome-binding protein
MSRLQRDLDRLMSPSTALFSNGSETAVAVLKSAVAAGNNALESVQKAVKQATEVAEANFNAVANTAVNAAKTTTRAKR